MPPSARACVVVAAGVQPTWGEWLAECGAFRPLFGALIERDLRVRYKRTLLGGAWVLLQPLLAGGVLAILVARNRGGNLPGGADWLAAWCAVAPWQFLTAAFGRAAGSFEAAPNLVHKVHLPRILIPTAAVAVQWFDHLLVMAVLCLVGMLGGGLPWTFPVWILMLSAAAAIPAGALGAAAAVLQARYRDFKHLMPFVVQMLTLTTLLPVFLPGAGPADWAWHPAAFLTAAYPAAFRGESIPSGAMLVAGLTACLVSLGALVLFRRRLAS